MPLLILALSPVVAAGAQPIGNWSQWLGNGRDGISRQDTWSPKWPESGLPVLWKQQIGIGFSSVSIVNGQLYTMGHIDGTEYVWCFSAGNGKKVWSHAYESPLVDNLYEGGPGSTPTVDKDRLYTLGKGGQMHCLKRHTGEVIWVKQLQEEFGVDLPEWGFNTSIFVHGNMLLVQGGRVGAFDKTTGRKIWQTERHKPGYGSATVFSHQGKELVATLDCDGLRIVQASDGVQIDFVEWPSPYRTNATTPIVRGDLIYISSGYNKGCGLFQLKDGKLNKIYANKEMRNHFNNSILLGDYLYGFDGDTHLGRAVSLTCTELATGKVMWKQRGYGCGSLIAANNHLVVLSETGNLALVAASPKGFEEVARSELLTGRCWSIPVIVSNRVYARNAAGDLVCAQLPEK